MAKAKSGLTVKGLGEVNQMLKELEPKLVGKVLRPAFRDAMKQVVLPLVRSRLPKKKATGRLSKALTVGAAKGMNDRRFPRGIFGSAVRFKDSRGDGNLFTGDQFYGGILEWGTKKHKTKPSHRIRPHKFLRSSLYDSRTALIAFATRAVKQYIPKIKAKASALAAAKAAKLNDTQFTR